MFGFNLQDNPVIPAIPAEDVAKEIDTTTFFDSLKGLGFEDALSKIASSLVNFTFKLLIAILVFYVGRFVIKKLYKVIFNMLTRKHVDASITTFALSLVKITLYFILIITVIGILGIETSSFLAIFASAGVAIGMALSGTLQNFAGGVLILLLKPYKVGDYIEVSGYTGTVKSIQLFNTVINTIDNRSIIIPNGVLSTSSINNYSLEPYRRIEWTVGLSYGTDFKAVREVLMAMLHSDDRVVKEFVEDDMKYREEQREEELKQNLPVENSQESGKKRSWLYRAFHRRAKQYAGNIIDSRYDMPVEIPKRVSRKPFVGLNELGDSAIVLVVRAWTHQDNYWPLYFEMNERIYTELPEHGFEFPFPQLDVHMDKE